MTTTGNPRPFTMRTAAAAPGRSLNSSTDRGECGPSGLATISLITPSRSRKTALLMLDPFFDCVHNQVVKQDVDALDDGRSEFIHEYRDGEAVIGHLSHGTAVVSTECDHARAGILGCLHCPNHVLGPGAGVAGPGSTVDREPDQRVSWLEPGSHLLGKDRAEAAVVRPRADQGGVVSQSQDFETRLAFDDRVLRQVGGKVAGGAGGAPVSHD